MMYRDFKRNKLINLPLFGLLIAMVAGSLLSSCAKSTTQTLINSHQLNLIKQQAEIMMASNRIVEAGECYEIIDQMNALTALSGLNYIGILRLDGQNERANEIIERLQPRFPNNPELAFECIKSNVIQKDFLKIDKIIGLFSQHPYNQSKLQQLTAQAIYITGDTRLADQYISRIDTTLLDEETLYQYYFLNAQMAESTNDMERLLTYAELLAINNWERISIQEVYLRILLQQGQIDKARSHFETCVLQLNHWPTKLCVVIVDSYLKEHNDDKAAEILLNLLNDTDESNTDKDLGIYLLQQYYPNLQLPKVYLPVLKRLYETNPTDSDKLSTLYMNTLRHQGAEAATELITKYCDQIQTAGTAYLFLAQEYGSMPEHDKEITKTYYDKALQFAPDKKDIILQYSAYLYAISETPLAITVLNDYLNDTTLPGDQSSVMLQLADIYDAIDNKDLAKVWYEKALQANSQNTMVLNNYAYFLADEGTELDQALNLITRAVEIDKNDENLLDTYAYILQLKGNYSMAALFMRRCIDLCEAANSPKATYYERYGDILFLNKNRTEAVKMWQKAYELSPSDSIKKKIDNHKM